MVKITCQACGYENKETMKFCINCGTKLNRETSSVENDESEIRFCEECGYPVEVGQAFCENCGNRIESGESTVEESEEIEESEVDEMEEAEGEIEEETVSIEEEEESQEEFPVESEENDVKFCKICGRKLKATQDFCPSCGTKVEEEFEEQSVEEEIEEEPVEEESKEVLEEPVIFCIECGSKLKPNQDFCPTCGAKVMEVELEPETNDSMLEGAEDSPEEEVVEQEIEEPSIVEEPEISEEESQSEEAPQEIEESQEEEETEEDSQVEEPIDVEEQPYCMECGKKLKKGQEFCIHCGTKVGEVKKEILVEPKEKKSKKKIILLLLFFLVLGGVILGFFLLNPKEKAKKEKEQKEVFVLVPSVIDKSQKEAIQLLEDLSFKVKIIEEETEDNEKVGIVFEQEPIDKKLKKKSEVTIKVYISAEKVEMIPVVGESLEEAKQKLQELGVETKVIEQASDEVEAGKIISQEVSGGEPVSKGSTVTITVSTGKEEQKEESKPTSKEEEKTPKPTSKETPTPTSKATPKPTAKVTPTPTPKPTATPNWSNWTASLPSNVTSSKYEIETKTEYRSRNKETTTSTSSSLSGWTKYDTKSEPVYSGNKTATVAWNEYNDFKNNSNRQIVSEEVIERDIHYGYCKSNNTYHSAPQVTRSCPSGTQYVTMQQTSTTLLDTSIINTYINKQFYDGTGSHLVLVVAMEPFQYKITYKEKSGENYTYYFYRWGSWSSWQEGPITSSDSVEVSTRTMYRYRAK